MKRFFILLAILGWAGIGSAQNASNYAKIVLEKPRDYKAADSMVLRLSNYLISSPIDGDKSERLLTEQFILRWMTGTPDYTFNIDDKTKALGENLDLMGVYFASMIKFEMENITISKDKDKVNLGTWKILLAYCENPDNHVKITKRLKKLMEANKNGELQKNI